MTDCSLIPNWHLISDDTNQKNLSSLNNQPDAELDLILTLHKIDEEDSLLSFELFSLSKTTKELDGSLFC